MPRFYCPQPLVPGTTIALPEAVAHHIAVVRLAPGELITLFNGEGGEVQASIVSVAKRSVTRRSARSTWRARSNCRMP